MRLSTMVMATVASVSLAMPVSSHAHTDRYTYVTSDSGAGGSTEQRVSDQETPAGHAALLGHFQVIPRGTSFTLNIDDVGTPNGLEVPVQVVDERHALFTGCVPVRTTITIRGARANEPVWIFIGSNIRCSGLASAGVVLLDGLA
jgi:hypothetical protein